jgi:hypothetical protein
MAEKQGLAWVGGLWGFKLRYSLRGLERCSQKLKGRSFKVEASKNLKEGDKDISFDKDRFLDKTVQQDAGLDPDTIKESLVSCQSSVNGPHSFLAINDGIATPCCHGRLHLCVCREKKGDSEPY